MQLIPQPYTILITDDDYISRTNLKRILKDMLLHIREAEDGQEALLELQQIGDKPVILLLDLNMPVKSGYDVIQEMHDNPTLYNKVKTIVISSALTNQFTGTGFEKYIQCYMEKPVTPNALIKEILTLMA